MKLTIITIVKNSENTLKKAIDSVLNQTYDNIEYILIDGCSTDGTVDIIQSFGSKIDKFICELDDGIYDAYNKGISLSTGDVIGFLNADDFYISTDTLSHVMDVFDLEESDIVYGDLQYENWDGKKLRIWKSSTFKPIKLNFGWMPPHPALFIKKSVYLKYGVFNKKYQISGDYDFIMRVFQQSDLKVCYLSEMIVSMITGGKSNKSLKNIVIKMKEDYNIIKKNQKWLFITLFFKNIRKIPQFLYRR